MLRAAGLAALLLLWTTTATADSIELRVMEARKPLAGVKVVALPLAEDGNPQIGGTTANGETWHDGRLTLQGLDRGPYRLVATAPDGRQVTNEVGFPAAGSLRGVMSIHPHGRPDAMDVILPEVAAFDQPVPVTVEVTDEYGQTCADGSKIHLQTDRGVLLAGKQKADGITLTTRAGRASAKLLAGKPGHATVTAKYGDSEVDSTVELHGELSYLLLELGPREPVNSYGTTPPGADIPILCTACDAAGHPIPNVPLQVWVQPLPGGRTVSGRTMTEADGKVQVTGMTEPAHQRYKVTVAHGKLTAAREFLVAEPALPWVEASASWHGVLGELTMTLHAEEADGELLTISAEPDDRVLILDDAGDDASLPMVDDQGQVTVTLFRLKPGPVDLTIEADGVWPAYLPLGGRLVLPAPAETATDMPLPDPAYREAGRADPDAWHKEPQQHGLIAYRGYDGAVNDYRLRTESRLLTFEPASRHPIFIRVIEDSRLAIATWDHSDRRQRFVVQRHSIGLGQTIEDSYKAKLLSMKTGFQEVWDISDDGRQVLVSTRPWLGNGGVTPLWVIDRYGQVDLVSAAWRQIDRATFGDGGVNVFGDRGNLRYGPLPATADGA